eukprot:2212811-Rhodomonas_salina.1
MLEQCLPIARKMGKQESERKAYRILGAPYKLRGKYERAIEMFEKDWTIAMETGNRAGEGAAYGNLRAAYDS